jgi:dihydrodipicolinate synthase/N-acetylneuraminate lyase
LNTIERPAAFTIPPLKPGRKIEGISAVLLPYRSDDQPDWEGFRRLLDRTWSAGLTPAVNMDTGYVNLLTPAERERALGETAEVSRSRRFVAGAFIEGDEGDPTVAYLRAVNEIRARGGIPILFQSSALRETSEQQVLDAYARVAESGGPMLAFELGRMFAPFGRIYSDDFFRRLLDIEAFTGLKHSSLDRELEWRRLQMRDRHRPGFKVYTGNDLAIDMVFYGSDYLLGLSAFAVDAFAVRDRLWAQNDSSAVQLNDLLQYLGQLAFRSPVPAYKHSAAQFLNLRGFIATNRPHPRSPRRPDSDIALLQDIRERLDAELTALSADRIA